MSKINALKKKYDDAAKTKTKLLAEIKALDQEAHHLKAKEAEAADNNDLNAYKTLKEAGRRVADSREFMELQLKKTETPADQAEIMDAWDTYAKKAEKKLNDALQAYHAARADILPLFCEVMDQLEAIYNERTALAKLTGTDASQLKFKAISNNDVAADRQFFARASLISKEDDARHGAILVRSSFNGLS